MPANAEQSAAPFVPDDRTLPVLQEAVQHCRGGKVQRVEGFPPIIATLHPSAILRARTDEDRERGPRIFQDDLRRVTDFLKK